MFHIKDTVFWIVTKCSFDLYGVRIQKITLFIAATVRTSNRNYFSWFYDGAIHRKKILTDTFLNDLKSLFTLCAANDMQQYK
jgi:hypothetical protein